MRQTSVESGAESVPTVSPDGAESKNEEGMAVGGMPPAAKTAVEPEAALSPMVSARPVEVEEEIPN
jgi:hypothetical protein